MLDSTSRSSTHNWLQSFFLPSLLFFEWIQNLIAVYISGISTIFEHEVKIYWYVLRRYINRATALTSLNQACCYIQRPFFILSWMTVAVISFNLAWNPMWRHELPCLICWVVVHCACKSRARQYSQNSVKAPCSSGLGIELDPNLRPKI